MNAEFNVPNYGTTYTEGGTNIAIGFASPVDRHSAAYGSVFVAEGLTVLRGFGAAFGFCWAINVEPLAEFCDGVFVPAVLHG